MFEFNFSLGKKELLAAKNHVLFVPALVVQSALIFGGFFHFFIGFLKTHTPLELYSALFCLVGVPLLFFGANKISNFRSIKMNKNFIGQKMNILFTQEKIIITAEKENIFKQTQEFLWKPLYKIRYDKQYYFFHTSAFMLFVIPKKSCTRGNESEFISFVQDKLKQLKGG